MDMQNVAKLEIPEGEVRTIHDKNGDLLWGKVSYGVKYKGDTAQNGTPTPSAPVPVKTVTGENVVKISDGQNEHNCEVNLGKNLFEVTASSPSVSGGVTYTKISDSSFSIASDGLSSWARADIALPQALEQNATYVFKVNFTSTNASITSVRASFRTASAEALVFTLTNGQTAIFSTGSNIITTLRIYISTNTAYSGTVTFTDVQLEKGFQSTSYASYFTPVELCKIGTYQDYIYPSGGKWYVHKETAKIACADISWAWDGTVPRLSYNASSLDVVRPSSTDTAWLAYSNKFKAYSFNYVYTQKNTGMAYSSSGFISLADTTWADQASAVASVQDCSIYYALATPTDTEITNQALITQLEAVSQWMTRYGYNASVTGNLPIIIDKTQL